MSLILDGKTIVGPGNSPYVGPNGHWWCGHDDLGIDAGTDIHYITANDFKTAHEEGIYYVYDPETNSVDCWHIDKGGKKYMVSDKEIIVPRVGPNGNWWIGDTDLGIPTSGGITGGAAIDDESINGTTVWSSKKVYDELRKAAKDGITGKNLEYKWDHTKLGVRQEGMTEYDFTDLVGPDGPAGLDGSSIIDVELEGTDLIVTIQDVDEYPLENSKILNIEKGFITAEDFKNLINEITRINTELANIKRSSFREYVHYDDDTDDEFDTILGLNGTGYCQIQCTPFKGAIRVTTDGVTYIATINDDIYNSMGQVSLVSIDHHNNLSVQEMFALDFTSSLDIRYNRYLNVEILVESGATFPKFIFQGSNYKNITFESDGIGTPDGSGIPNIMTERDVDIMMGLVTSSYIASSSPLPDRIGDIKL